MDDILEKTAVVILAAGKGTRLNEGKPSKVPKVLHKVAGRPMIAYTMNNLKSIGFSEIVVVVGYKAREVKRFLGNKTLKFVAQKKQLGTGHAMQIAEKALPKNVEHVLLINGDDSAFYHRDTIKKLLSWHDKEKAVMTLLTLRHPGPKGLGRVIRGRDKHVDAIIEESDATKEQIKIKEINTGTYCFDRKWLSKNLKKLKMHPNKGEFYVTDLVAIAIKDKKKVTAHRITDRNEWVGINTKEQLAYAEGAMKERLRIREEV